MRKERAGEVDENEEALKVLNRVWLGIVENGVYVGGEGSDAGGGDLVGKEGNRRLGKGAFGEVNKKAIGPENVKELCEMGKVLGKSGTGHENVIQVNKKERKGMEKVVH